MINIFTLLLSVLIIFSANAQETAKDTHYLGTYVRHDGYYLIYDEQHEQPIVVSYSLTKEALDYDYKRGGYFRKDDLVYTESASNKDYYKSGYDRGHLAPARDFPEDPKVTFYYSNVSPQVPGFNRGVWKRLEELVRDIAVDKGQLYISTGPIFRDSLYKTIGPDSVAVPDAFYKTLLYVGDSGFVRGIGFILNNESSSEPLKDFVVTIDSVEKVTGFNYYPSLTSDEEKEAESSIDTLFWGVDQY